MFSSPRRSSGKFGRVRCWLTTGLSAGFLLLGGGIRAETASPPAAPASNEIIEIVSGAPKSIPVAPRTFSDADEVAGSDSAVAATSSPKGLRLEYKIKAYGGVVLREGVFDAARMANMRVRIWQLEGKPLQAVLQFTSASGTRSTFPIEILPVGDAGDRRERTVPFGHFTAFNSTPLAETQQVSLILPAGTGVLEIESLAFVNGKTPTVSAFPPAPAKSRTAMPEGAGAWCYGSPAFVVGEVSRYNASVAPMQRIRYLFPNTGRLDVDANGQPDLLWRAEVPGALRKELDGAGLQDVLVLPMIDGLTGNLSQMSEADAKKVAREIGAHLEKDPACAGVHFDLEPHDPFTYVIFADLREFTAKPITAAVESIDDNLFRYLDMTVLMAYDLAATPAKYEPIARGRISRFLALAEATHGRAMIGVPAIATHHEMAASSESLTGPRQETGYQMTDFVRDAFQLTDQALKTGPHPGFMGYSIWAIHEPEAVHDPSEVRYFFPGRVSPEVWTLFRERALP